MIAAQYANLALRFLLELCVLAALAYWGSKTGSGLLTKILFAIGAPLLAAVVWGMFGSPGASMPLHGVWHLLLEGVVFGSGAVALHAAGRPGFALAFVLTVVINRVLMYVWGQ